MMMSTASNSQLAVLLRARPSSMAPRFFLLLFVLAAALLCSPAAAAPDEHLVTSLPGFHGAFPSKHYSGYVTVDDRSERSLFYYLILSEREPAADPVVVWLNGGPGCSSFDGFVYGNGPFNFEPGGTPGGLPKLKLNPYSWSKVSNIMYLDSPAGVGMSYSLNKSDYTTGDLKTAADAHTFLLKWFELYPEFQSNPFYISGESYAGVYIPTITDEVVKGIDKGVRPRINFKGYLIGNPATDVDYDFNSFVPFAHGMGLISTDMYEDVKSACRGTFFGTVDNSCQENIDRVHRELKDLNKYNILAPCYHHPEIQEIEFINSSLPLSFRRLGETERPFPVRKRMAGRSWPLRVALKDGHVPMWPGLGGRSLPCTSDELVTAWLDDEDVRAAIHAKSKSLIGSWELYTARIDFTHDTGTMVTYHKKFTALGYRVLIYSGDHDLCIPYPGTEAWVKSLGYHVVDGWRPWYLGDQVAGYVVCPPSFIGIVADLKQLTRSPPLNKNKHKIFWIFLCRNDLSFKCNSLFFNILFLSKNKFSNCPTASWQCRSINHETLTPAEFKNDLLSADCEKEKLVCTC